MRKLSIAILIFIICWFSYWLLVWTVQPLLNEENVQIIKIDSSTSTVSILKIKKTILPIKVIIGNKNSLAYKLNNPGNLKYANQPNSTKGEGNFSRFQTVQQGYEALIRQITKDQSRNLTIKQFVNKFAPPSDKNFYNRKYVAVLSTGCGGRSDTNINLLSVECLANNIIWVESGSYIEK